MNKSVLISIRPKWIEKIARGEKTIEVRKSRPKLETPFKCYIYCTKAQNPVLVALQNLEDSPYVMTCGTGTRRYPVEDASWARLLNGTVCGEFTCDHIYQYTTMAIKDGTDICDEDMERLSCLTHRELADYEASSMKEEGLWYFGLYGWHISHLKIYDEPKELGSFIHPSTGCCNEGKCDGCKYLERGYGYLEDDCCADFDTDSFSPLRRPPISWCYVEEAE